MTRLTKFTGLSVKQKNLFISFNVKVKAHVRYVFGYLFRICIVIKQLYYPHFVEALVISLYINQVRP